MLFMVIERFSQGRLDLVGRRFKTHGRMIPENAGISYVQSWMTTDAAACFQIMEAPSREALNPWIDAWRDLVDFEVIPIQTSHDFWTARAAGISAHSS